MAEATVTHLERPFSHNLAEEILDDLGNLFEAIKQSRGADAHIKSLCSSGEFLCEEWKHLLLREMGDAKYQQREAV